MVNCVGYVCDVLVLIAVFRLLALLGKFNEGEGGGDHELQYEWKTGTKLTDRRILSSRQRLGSGRW